MVLIKIDWKKFFMKNGLFGYYLWCDSWLTDMDDGYKEIQVQDWYITTYGKPQGWIKICKVRSDWSLLERKFK